MKQFTLTLLFTFLIVAQTTQIDSLESVLSSGKGTTETKYTLALLYHDEVAKEENGDYTDRAEELFKEVLTEDKTNAMALAYYGSLMTLMGRDAFLPWNKMKYVEQGCDKMDKAITIQPDNITIRMTRAMNNVNLPDFFNRIGYILEDFKYLRENQAFSSFDTSMQTEIFFYSGVTYEKNDEVLKAKEMYKKAVETGSKTQLVARAQEALSDLSE